MNISIGFCKQCNKDTKIEYHGLNHFKHIILTILTFGIWGIVYGSLLVATLFDGMGWKCSECGSDDVDKK